MVTTDDLNGVPALERQHPTVPLAPGTVERQGVEYLQHGTCILILAAEASRRA